MARTLEREQTGRVISLRRRRVAETTCLVLGALAAVKGLYFTYAPSNWAFRGLGEGWRTYAWAASGLLLAAGFGLYAGRTKGEDGSWSGRAVTGMTLALLALAGAVFAVVRWVL